jgi:hypothetical protein
MSATTRKAALLEQIEQERQIWEQLLAEVGEGRMLEPGVTADWTFKDVVAHLNGWRVLTLARLEAARHGRAPEPPPWPAHLDEDVEADVDQINDWIYRASQDRPLQDVLAEYSQSFERMRAAVAAIPERDLMDPGRYPWLGGYPLAAVLEGTFGHLHEEHEPALKAWLGRIGGAA